MAQVAWETTFDPDGPTLQRACGEHGAAVRFRSSAHATLEPDGLVVLEDGESSGRRASILVEADMGTQGPKRIVAKIGRYLQYLACLLDDDMRDSGLPVVLFLCVGEARAERVGACIDGALEDAHRPLAATLFDRGLAPEDAILVTSLEWGRRGPGALGASCRAALSGASRSVLDSFPLPGGRAAVGDRSVP